MDRHDRILKNYTLSNYKLNLFYEIKEIEKKYNSVEVGMALYEVIKLLVDDVVEQKEQECINESEQTNGTL